MNPKELQMTPPNDIPFQEKTLNEILIETLNETLAETLSCHPKETFNEILDWNPKWNLKWH